MKSLSEIDTVSKRSSKAAGYSWGVAEEIGKNIRLLEMFSLPGIKNLNDFLKKKKYLKLENLKLINETNKTTNSQLCPIVAGISFLDQIRSLENLPSIQFVNVSYPLLFFPFVSRASEVIGKRIFFKFDRYEFLINFNNSIFSNFQKNEIIEIAKNVNIRIFNNQDSFNESEWKELYRLSENTFVEERDSLKKEGAGAGLTDND